MTEAGHNALPPGIVERTIRHGLSFDDYVGQVSEHGDRMRHIRQTLAFTDREAEWIAAIARPLRLFAIVESWCTDVVANLPIVAGIVDLNPLLSLSVLSRPDHTDLVAHYLHPATGRSHVPTYVLFEGDREQAILFERPEAITAIIVPFVQAMKAEHAAATGLPEKQFAPEAIMDMVAKSLARRAECHDLERHEIARWFATCGAARAIDPEERGSS